MSNRNLIWEAFMKRFLQIWCVCCHEYCITVILGREWRPECECKLQRYVPGDREGLFFTQQLHSGSCLFSQTAKLIKKECVSLDPAEFLPLCPLRNKVMQHIFKKQEKALFQTQYSGVTGHAVIDQVGSVRSSCALLSSLCFLVFF